MTPNPAHPPIVGVHLDLKGMMFKPAYIPRMLEDLASQGVNCVLVEYEDIFPFKRIRVAHDRSVAWSRATLDDFLTRCKKLGIEVIPLQQCLGHLEYALGWDRYRHLAENREYPSTIRVDSPEARAFVLDMLAQVVEAHPDSKYVHVGMDEAHALHDAAKRLKRDVLELFLDMLRVVLPVVERAGKTAYVWTDMLEDHFRPDAFEEFKDRVIWGTWDYGKYTGETTPLCRLTGGTRVSRAWLNEPDNPAAPPIGPGTPFVEDARPEIRRVLQEYVRTAPRGSHQESRPEGTGLKKAASKYKGFLANFQIDLWSKLGGKVLPVSALRVSANYSVMPPYNALLSNVRGWSVAVKRTKQMGQIGTSWARGTSWCPPNYCIDLQWPVIGEMCRTMGVLPRPFFDGIAPATVERIVKTLGRCRDDWRLEGKIADEMESLAPRLRGKHGHRYEWDSMILMARVLQWQRRAAYNIEEVEYFHANHRPVDSEWARRIREQKETLRDLAALRKKVITHFGKRYHGKAFREWIDTLFGLHEEKLKACRAVCVRKMRLAKKAYAE